VNVAKGTSACSLGGIDWEGPVSVDDEETVTVKELAELLSKRKN
jgi:hypothetical protein